MKRNPDSYRRVITEAQKARLREVNTIHGHAATRHRRHTRTYQSWMSMKERCDDPRHKSYADYGGRGISYCKAWGNFIGFLADMGERPAGKTLGRLDNDGDYEPSNCAWQTHVEQCRNRSNNRVLEFAGRRLTLAGWAELLGLTQDALQKRLDNGWSLERSLTEPPKRQRNSKCNFRPLPPEPKGQADLFPLRCP